MKTTRQLLIVILLLSVMCSNLALSKPAFAKSVSKATKMVTLTNKKSSVIHKLSIHPSEMVRVKVKFLDVKGKTSLSNDELYLGEYEFEIYKKRKFYDGGKGAFFHYGLIPN